MTIKNHTTILRRKVRRHLRRLGFKNGADGSLVPPNLSKDAYRLLHEYQRVEKYKSNVAFISKRKSLLKYMASGHEVYPPLIRPRLEVVESNSLESDLFRFASLYWRVPVSPGYGRRIRFLVWDDHNGKLIGLFALGDPVFNLKVRDQLIGWDHEMRARRLTNLMDAYVLGAIPPYNALLGGKLVACLVRTKEVVDAFKAKYKRSEGIISKAAKRPQLVAVTTTSALGRSSIYNRLKLGGDTYFRPVGYTSGWGHFHIPDRLFTELREYLRAKRDPYFDTFNFGEGPNWRLRTIKKALVSLGMKNQLAKHGLMREVYVSFLAENAVEYLIGEAVKPQYGGLLGVDDVSRLAIDRWMLPRAERRPEYRLWNAEQLLHCFKGVSETL